jgi:hypothetical protein
MAGGESPLPRRLIGALIELAPLKPEEDLPETLRPASLQIRAAMHLAEPADDEGSIAASVNAMSHSADDPSLPRGFTSAQFPPEVQLHAGLAPRGLCAVILHEVKHVMDTRHPALSLKDREARAEEFEERWTPVACRVLGIR